MAVAIQEGMKRERNFDDLLLRLADRSVTKHFDAYADIDWDAYPVDPADPRFVIPTDIGLGSTDWYQSQPEAVRAALGLEIVAQQMKVGVVFENVLSKGLLEFAMSQPEGSPAFRYAYHEVIEEGQHSLMFQEFINRSGAKPPGVGRLRYFAARNVIPRLARSFPELFFIMALAGEAPIDHVQRRILASDKELHPLVERITRIHITEEARHICFAREYLRENVPKLGAVRRAHLRLRVPLALTMTARLMLEPPREILERHDVPREVVREAFTNNAAHRKNVADGVAPIRKLCEELDILTPTTRPLWRAITV